MGPFYSRSSDALQPLETLTQPTITGFSWDGGDWQSCLFYLPKTTLNQLTSVDLHYWYEFPWLPIDLDDESPPDDRKFDEQLMDHFCRPFAQLRSLTSFKLYGPNSFFDCKCFSEILDRIPSRLEVLWFNVTDWDYGVVQQALEKQTRLTEVSFDTRDMEVGDKEARRMNETLRIPKLEFNGRSDLGRRSVRTESRPYERDD
ncbi:hypothetical protein HDV00_008333 [Rhizophlyctis rosea]|nr:hypothetical protein HDV00_008333 [Rhizophlyctis rosea]